MSKRRRWLAFVLCAAMVGSSVGTSTYAENITTGDVCTEEDAHEHEQTAIGLESIQTISDVPDTPVSGDTDAQEGQDVPAAASEQLTDEDDEPSGQPTEVPETEPATDPSAPKSTPGVQNSDPTEDDGPGISPTAAPQPDTTESDQPGSAVPTADPEEIPGIGDEPSAGPEGAPGIADSNDNTQPVITITQLIPGHGDNNAVFCEAPNVNVTDAGNNLANIAVELSTYVGTKEEFNESGKSIPNPNPSSQSVDLSGLEGNKIRITATDSAENTISKIIYVSHQLGVRQEVTIKPTCTTKGKTVMNYTCKFCSTIYYSYETEKPVDPTGHEHDENESETYTPCGGESVTLYKCKNCGLYVTKDDKEYDVTDGEHEWLHEEKKETCTEPGMKYEKCQKCGAVKDVEQIPATGHNYGPTENIYEGDKPNCETLMKRVRKCTHPGCDEMIVVGQVGAQNHSYRRYLEVVKEATCEEDGIRSYVCEKCGAYDESRAQSIPRKGHTYSETGDCTKTVQCEVCHKVVEGQSSHAWSDSYKSDWNSHWKYCTNPGCRQIQDKVSHDSEIDGKDCTKDWKCETCGYVVEGNSSHIYETVSDENFHWKVCRRPGCQFVGTKFAHTPQKSLQDCTASFTCLVCHEVVPGKAEHNFSDNYTYTIGGTHWRACTNPGCNVRTDQGDHKYSIQTGDCTRNIECEICGYVAYNGNIGHYFKNAPWIDGGEEGHYQVCQNRDTRGNPCTHQSDMQEHTGGNATCRTKAICDICHASYGDFDSTKHESEELVGYREPTETEDGYSGDLKCTACGAIIKQGTVLKKETTCTHPAEHVVREYDDNAAWDRCEDCNAIIGEKIPHTLVQKSDADGHWKECLTCKHSTPKTGHTAGEDDGDCTTPLLCTECGYHILEIKSHVFSGSDYASDYESHWLVCRNEGCAQKQMEAHVPETDDGDCTTAVKCAVCQTNVTPGISHNWSSEWHKDEEGHYRICTNAGCNATTKKTEHELLTDDSDCGTPGICKECGYEITPAKEHVFGGDYKSSSTGHWQVCQNPGCSQVSGESMHRSIDLMKANCIQAAVCSICGASYGEKDPKNHTGRTEIKGYIAPTLEKEGYTGDTYCMDCGALVEYGNNLDKLEEEDHVFEIEKSDDTHHWKECRCGTRSGYEPHSFGEYGSDNTHHWRVCSVCGHVERENHLFEDGKCTVCGFSRAVHQHSFEWKSDGENHYQECSVCKETVNNEPHTLVGMKDEQFHWQECSVCGYATEKSDHHLVQKGDGEYHWMECSVESCAYQTSKEVHEGEDDGNCTTALVCKKCGAVMREAQAAHNWSSSFTHDAKQHWQECQNLGCTQKSEATAHVMVGSKSDCTQDYKCKDCTYVEIYGEMTHNFEGSPYYGNADGHWQECQNGDCTVLSKDVPGLSMEAHRGGTATCVRKAICSLCHEEYGEVDSSNHESRVLKNAKEPTAEEEGYTGDFWCTVCNTLIEKGSVIAKQSCEHTYSTDPDQQQFDDEGSWYVCTKCGLPGEKVPHQLTLTGWDDTGHWKQCSSCKHKTTVVPHTMSDGTFDHDCTTATVCSEEDCGYKLAKEYGEHRFDGGLLYNETGHWHVCQNPDCTVTDEVKPHTPDSNRTNCTSSTICTECGHTLFVGEAQHDWDTVWHSDEQGHYHVCLNTGCEEKSYENHVVTDDGICTTPAVCTICNYEVAAAKEHQFGGMYYTGVNGHWQKCTNPGCEAESDVEPHRGGTATCVKLAECEVCGKAYRSMDSTHHDPQKNHLVGYVEPTQESEGYSGDTICGDCGSTVKEGHVLDKLPGGHEHNFNIHTFDASHHWLECECGARQEGSYVEHTMGAWEYASSVDCLKGGTQSRTCTGCDYTETREADAPGHAWNRGKCDRCGALLELADEENLQSQQRELEAQKEAAQTDEERQAIEAKLAFVADAINSLNKVYAVGSRIAALPKPAQVTKDDKDVIREAVEAYNALSEAEKRLVSEADKAQLDAVVEALNKQLEPKEIPVISGQDQTWDKESKETPTFVLETPVGRVYRVTVDGVELSPEDYTVSEDWLTFSLSPKYYYDLTEGEHNITIYGEEGYSWTTFTVVETEEPDTETEEPTETETEKPTETESEKQTEKQTETAKATEKSGAVATGDETNMMIWLLVLLVSGSYAVCLATDRKRRGNRS